MQIRGRGWSGKWCRQNMENESSHDLLVRQPSQKPWWTGWDQDGLGWRDRPVGWRRAWSNRRKSTTWSRAWEDRGITLPRIWISGRRSAPVQRAPTRPGRGRDPSARVSVSQIEKGGIPFPPTGAAESSSHCATTLRYCRSTAIQYNMVISIFDCPRQLHNRSVLLVELCSPGLGQGVELWLRLGASLWSWCWAMLTWHRVSKLPPFQSNFLVSWPQMLEIGKISQNCRNPYISTVQM